MKKSLISILMVLMVITLVLSPVVLAKTRITIWWPQGENESAVLKSAIEDFSKEYPEIEIVPAWQGQANYQDKFQISFVGGKGPDIVRLDHIWVQSFGYKRMLLDLNQFGVNEIKDKYFQGAWQANLYQDQVFALPFDANTIALMYNQELLNETATEVPTNLEELIAAAKQNTRDTDGDGQIDLWGYTIPNAPKNSGWMQFQFLFWVWRNGGEVLNQDWTEAVYNSKEAVEALQLLKDIGYKHKVAPVSAYYEDDFYNGGVAFLDMGCWHMGKITEEGRPFAYALLPELKPEIGSVSGLGLYSLAINSASKNPEAAYQFIKFLSASKKYQIMWAHKTNLLPSLKDGFDHHYFQTKDWQVFKEQMEHVKTRPGTPAWPEIQEHMSVAIQKVLLNKATPQEALDEAVAKSNKSLAKYK